MSYKQPSGIILTSGTLATIAGADTTAIQLIAAPGSGFILIVHGVFLNIKNGTTPWTGVGNAWLVYGTTGNDQVNLATPFLTNLIQGGTASTNYVASSVLGIGSDWLGATVGTINRVTSGNSVNKPVSFTCSNAVTAGNGTIDWKIWYSVIAAA